MASSRALPPGGGARSGCPSQRSTPAEPAPSKPIYRPRPISATSSLLGHTKWAATRKRCTVTASLPGWPHHSRRTIEPGWSGKHRGKRHGRGLSCCLRAWPSGHDPRKGGRPAWSSSSSPSQASRCGGRRGGRRQGRRQQRRERRRSREEEAERQRRELTATQDLAPRGLIRPRLGKGGHRLLTRAA
jgi:hypothetical protein